MKEFIGAIFLVAWIMFGFSVAERAAQQQVSAFAQSITDQLQLPTH